MTDLRRRIDRSDAILLCTPEYAGDLPGSFKNLLDWTVGGVEIVDKPTAWINVSTRGPVGAQATHDSLRRVLGFTGARIVDDACRHLAVPPSALGDDGSVHEPRLRQQLAEVLTTLAAACAATPPATDDR